MRIFLRASHTRFIARYLIQSYFSLRVEIPRVCLLYMAGSLESPAYMHCLWFLVPQIHFDRYKHSIYSHGSDPFLRALGTRDAASTRFHACERFDRCSFVDVPPYDYGAKGGIAPPSLEGKKVVYVNAVNMSCSRWEDYQANIKHQVSRGENVNSLASRDAVLP